VLSILSLCLMAGAVLGQSGCTTGLAEYIHNGFKVGPNYHRPPAPLPAGWVDQNDSRVHVGDPNLAAWWDVFDDPILTGLLQRAHWRNLTVRAAGFQILEAQAQRALALGELFPQSQGYSFQYTRSIASENQGSGVGLTSAFGTSLAPAAVLSPVPTPTTTSVAGTTSSAGTSSAASTGTTLAMGTPQSTTTTSRSPSVGSSIGGSVATPGGSAGAGRYFSNIATSLNASWEIDFWGLFRRNLEAADASLDQSVENYDEMLVLLMANVATQYIEIRTLQKRLELARENVALQEPLVQTFYRRYQAGVANSYPGYYQLKANLENTRALIPQLESSLRQANNQLCVLLGIPVRDLLPELGDGTVPDPANPSKRVVRIPRPRTEAVVVGIPGNLLLRRPDVQAAERQLKIQSAQIGIAEAEMYPHVGINGSIGLAANSLSRLFETRSITGSIGPSLSWNILNYGRLLAMVRFQDYEYQQFVAQYLETVLSANQDVENALVAYLQTLEQTRHLQESADAASKLSTYLIQQLAKGYLPPGSGDTSAFINQVFTAVNFQVTQQDAAAQAEGNISLNLILLYRAMGGGWQIRLQDLENHCPNLGPDDFRLLVTAQQVAPSTVPQPVPAKEGVGPAKPAPAPKQPSPAESVPAPAKGEAAASTSGPIIKAYWQ
jgi:NodT family efflux transporter outer membrane factor (OMF) lipoprotein